MSAGKLDLGSWDIPYSDIEDIYVIDAPDGGESYLIVKAYGLDIAVYSDDDPDLVARSMTALSEAAEIGCMAVPCEPGAEDDDD